jgi:hypothetical protein
MESFSDEGKTKKEIQLKNRELKKLEDQKMILLDVIK